MLLAGTFNRAILLAISILGIGLFALLPSSNPKSDPAQRPESEHTVLEEWWNLGQGKGFRWWATDTDSFSGESVVLHELIADRTNRQSWSHQEILDLSRFILSKSQEYRISPFLVLSMIDVESGYQPAAISSAGAIGMLQLLPATAKDMAAVSGVRWTGPHLLVDPKINIDLGLRYVRTLKREFKSDDRVLAAYNFGPQAIRDRLSRGEEIPSVYFERVMKRFGEYQKKAKLSKAQTRNWSRTWL